MADGARGTSIAETGRQYMRPMLKSFWWLVSDKVAVFSSATSSNLARAARTALAILFSAIA
jgi:hypothetical protein